MARTSPRGLTEPHSDARAPRFGDVRRFSVDHEAHLTGRTMQGANTRDMILGVAETIELLTECLTLEPGDVVVMGTPAGVGHARRPPVWMRPGDVVEVEIEGVGVLRNPIEDEPAPAR